jgi:hypothetical protein
MNTKRLTTRGLLIAGVMGLAIYFSFSVAAGQPSRLFSAYPGPRPTQAVRLSHPTPADGKAEQVRTILVTPLPSEKVYAAELEEVAQPITSPAARYSIREETKPGDLFSIYALFVQDAKAGSEFRLGDDNGDARFYALTDEYVIWSYHRYEGDELAELKTGLYIYHLASGKSITITRSGGAYPEIDGQWVIYLSKGDQYLAGLYAYNLITGEELSLSKRIPVMAGRRTSDFYAVGEGQAAWVENDPVSQKNVVHFYEMNTHRGHILDVPDTVDPMYVTVSRAAVMWRDGFWRGYEFKHDALFTIPVIPPGWEGVPVQTVRPLTVQGDRLQWALEVNGKNYHFTALIALRGQGSGNTRIVPTPIQEPANFPEASPIPPTATALAVAYP